MPRSDAQPARDERADGSHKERKPMSCNARTNMKQIVAVVERGEGSEAKSFWTRIGVAFENRDGSWNLRFDYFPTKPDTTVQLRDIEAREERGDGEREHQRGR
jgi:hypothetical protein